MIMMVIGGTCIGIALDQEEGQETVQGHALDLVSEKSILIVLAICFYCFKM